VSMNLIPVLDLARGRAVHARGGDRATYQPVHSVLAPGARGDAVALLHAYAIQGARTCYIADLDAIQGAGLQVDALRTLWQTAQPAGVNLWLDAGSAAVKDPLEVARLTDALVIGSETLTRWDDLESVARLVGHGRVVFSLDLRGGRPLGLAAKNASPLEVVRKVQGAGIGRVVLLDLGRVGTRTGPDLDLIRSLRGACPNLALYVGGGVTSAEELKALGELGVAGALVATALHQGLLHLEPG